MMCLIYHIDKGLGVVLGKATNCVTHILVCKDHFDEGGEFIRDKVASDQTCEDYVLKFREKNRLQSTFHIRSMVKVRTTPTTLGHKGHGGVARINR